jgi:hypothetical protein
MACTEPGRSTAARREAFVEVVLAPFPPLPFGLLAAAARGAGLHRLHLMLGGGG